MNYSSCQNIKFLPTLEKSQHCKRWTFLSVSINFPQISASISFQFSCRGSHTRDVQRSNGVRGLSIPASNNSPKYNYLKRQFPVNISNSSFFFKSKSLSFQEILNIFNQTKLMIVNKYSISTRLRTILILMMTVMRTQVCFKCQYRPHIANVVLRTLAYLFAYALFALMLLLSVCRKFIATPLVSAIPVRIVPKEFNLNINLASMVANPYSSTSFDVLFICNIFSIFAKNGCYKLFDPFPCCKQR